MRLVLESATNALMDMAKLPLAYVHCVLLTVEEDAKGVAVARAMNVNQDMD
jgi:hypothetical protein